MVGERYDVYVNHVTRGEIFAKKIHGQYVLGDGTHVPAEAFRESYMLRGPLEVDPIDAYKSLRYLDTMSGVIVTARKVQETTHVSRVPAQSDMHIAYAGDYVVTDSVGSYAVRYPNFEEWYVVAPREAAMPDAPELPPAEKESFVDLSDGVLGLMHDTFSRAVDIVAESANKADAILKLTDVIDEIADAQILRLKTQLTVLTRRVCALETMLEHADKAVT